MSAAGHSALARDAGRRAAHLDERRPAGRDARRHRRQALRAPDATHALQRAPVGIFQTGLSGSTTYINPHFSEVTGLAAEEAVEKGWLAAVHPEDVARVREEWCLASARQQVYAGELRFLRSDGTVRWALAFASPERDRDGSFNGYIGTITDITGRLQAERVIESQNRVLEMIAKGSPLAETLTTLLRSVEEQAPGMLSSILLLDAAGIHVRHGAAPGLPADYVRALDGVAIGERAASCGTAAYLRPVIAEDIATDPPGATTRSLSCSRPLVDTHLRRAGGVLGRSRYFQSHAAATTSAPHPASRRSPRSRLPAIGRRQPCGRPIGVEALSG